MDQFGVDMMLDIMYTGRVSWCACHMKRVASPGLRWCVNKAGKTAAVEAAGLRGHK